MAINGTGARWIENITHPQGLPGGAIDITVALAPTGSYPANGELVSDVLALFEQFKAVAGVRPSNVVINDNLGHMWQYDAAIGTMGSLRNYTAIGATPTEHSTGAYGGNEASALLRVTFRFPLYGSMSR